MEKVDLVAYATSSVVLYEAVSLDEFCDIVHHWHPELPLDTKEVEKVLSKFVDENEDALFIVRNGYVCHYMLGMAGENLLSLLGDFFTRRGDKTRWMPETEEEFLAYNMDEVHIESPEGEEFEEFLSKHGLKDDDERLEMLLPIMYDHQYGVSTQRSLSNLMARLKLKSQKDTIKFTQLLSAFLNTMHLQINYGWTPQEMLRT